MPDAQKITGRRFPRQSPSPQTLSSGLRPTPLGIGDQEAVANANPLLSTLVPVEVQSSCPIQRATEELRHAYKGWYWIVYPYFDGYYIDQPWHEARRPGDYRILHFGRWAGYQPRHFEIMVDHDLIGKSAPRGNWHPDAIDALVAMEVAA